MTDYVETTDGRTLAYEQQGDPGGTPVFVLHGTPGSRLSGRHPDDAKVNEAGLWLITYDRPGYGHSARHLGRSVVDCVADIRAIADLLGIERFAVTGGSGGGPHALAVAARLADRVTRAESNVGIAPYDADGLDWFSGMDPANVEETQWALAGEEKLSAEIEREATRVLGQLDDDPAALLSEFDLAEADRAALQQEVVKERIRQSMRASLENGVWGWVDDDLAFVKPWGFDVGEIRVPVQIRYGAQDVLVPAAHGAWLGSHVPGARVVVDEAKGHIATPDQHLDNLIAFLAD